MKVARIKEMQAMDRYAIDELAIPEQILMENAGQAAAFVLERELGIRGKRYAVICGIGNNGGDGFVLARKIHSQGGLVQVFVLGDEGRFKGSAKMNLAILKKLPIPLTSISSLPLLRKGFVHIDGIVDAIFGIGLDREIQGFHKDVITVINKAGRKVLSLDIPSGVHGDTGRIMGAAVKADFTVTFGLPKAGNLLYPGYDLGGKLYVSHISFPPMLYEREDLKIQTNDPLPLPRRNPQSHKGSVGDCLFIAGAAGYYGAPFFSAMSFLKAGGGYARLAAPASLIGFVAQNGPEIVFAPQKETASGTLALESRDALVQLSQKVDMVVIGPGLSLKRETQRLVRDVVRDIQVPVLIDGDGITAIAEDLDAIRERSAATVLTPHPGEMARLTGKSIREIGEDRLHVLQQTALILQAIIVLKGPHSLIGYPDGRIFVNLSGNSGMATAGAGDVLTGTIAAMNGLGLPIEEAVRKGVFIHGLAGDLGAADKGADGITARDILESLPRALQQDRAGMTEEILRKGIVICP